MPIRNRFQQRAAVQVARPVPAESTVAATMADVFSDFSDKATNRLAELVVNDERRAGLIAGAAGSPQLREDRTLAGEAFNAGAIAAWGARLNNQIDADISKMEAEASTLEASKRLPAFDALTEKAREAFLDGLPEQMVPEVTVQFEARALKSRSRLFDGFIAEEQQANQAAAALDLQNQMSAIETAWFQGNAQEAFILTQDFADRMEINQRAGLMSEAQALVLTDEQSKAAVQAIYRGQFDRALDANAGVEFLMWFAENPPEGLPTDEVDTAISTMLSDLATSQRLRGTLRAEAEAVKKETQESNYNAMVVQSLDPANPLLLDELLQRGADEDIDGGQVIRLNSLLAPTVGPRDSDSLEKFNVMINLYDMVDPMELANNPKLSETDKLAFGQQWLNRPRFTSSQYYVEGARRIKGELGILDGELASNDKKSEARLASDALSQFFDEMEALAPEKRKLEARDIADKIMGRNYVGYFTDQVAQQKARIAFQVKQLETLDEEENKEEWDMFTLGISQEEAKLELLQDRLKENVERHKQAQQKQQSK